MKIECPNCKLSGEMSEHDVPLDGRYVDCPRCKTGFHIKKPLAKGWNPDMMSVCPSCNYSTFTDETFAVCPKCGVRGREHNEKKLKLQEEEQAKRDMERLNKSLRPDDFVKPPAKEVESGLANLPPLVRFTAIGVLVVAFLLAFYGLMGLMRYDSNALMEKMSETSLEPVSEATVFLAHGLLPLILTIYGGIMALLASFLLRMRNNAVKWLEFGAWGGLAIGVACEVVDYISYIRRSSETPSIAYLLVGFMNSVLMLAVWVSLPLALVWWLRSDHFLDQLEGE